MKKKLFILFIYLMTGIRIFSQNFTSTDSLHFKITDSRSKPLYGVHIQQESSGLLLATTDEQGETVIVAGELEKDGKIILHSLGFRSEIIPYHKLKLQNSFRLTEASFDLDEAVIRGIKMKDLLRSAQQENEKSKRKLFASIYEQYYGKGQYMKITECFGKAVEFRREYGCFLTTGNIPRNVDLSTTEYTFEELEDNPNHQKFFTGSDNFRNPDQTIFMEEVNNYQMFDKPIFSDYRSLMDVFNAVLRRKDVSSEFINRILKYKSIVNTFDKYDMEYDFSFIPVYSQRSLCLDASRKDTMAIKFNNRFDAGSNKLFTIMRCIYLYAPIFSPSGNYRFELVGGDHVREYAVDFITDPKKFPASTEVYCKGRMWIDRESRKLTRMKFDYFDYYAYHMAHRKIGKAPFETAVIVEFDYDKENVCYIKSCKSVTYWTPRQELDKTTSVFPVEAPSRPMASDIGLTEMEGFRIYSFLPLPEDQQTKEIGEAARLAIKNPMGEYRPEILDSLPALWKCTSSLADLNAFMPITEQFKWNSNKCYYLQGGKYFHPQQTLEARQKIIDLFWKETE